MYQIFVKQCIKEKRSVNCITLRKLCIEDVSKLENFNYYCRPLQSRQKEVYASQTEVLS